MWLPPGGHVEPNEVPDDAAVREVREESGVDVELVGERAIDAPGPRQLMRPRGVQLERIAPGHEHVDLVYLARPVAGYGGRLGGAGAARAGQRLAARRRVRAARTLLLGARSGYTPACTSEVARPAASPCVTGVPSGGLRSRAVAGRSAAW